MNSQILYQRWRWWRPLENIKISSTLLELALKEVRCQDMMNQNLLFEREESTRPAPTPTLHTHKKKKEKKWRLFGHIIIILIWFQGNGWVWKKEPWADTNLPQDFTQYLFSQSPNNKKDWWHNFSEPFDLTPVAVISNDVASGRADKSKNSLLFCRNKEFAIYFSSYLGFSYTPPVIAFLLQTYTARKIRSTEPVLCIISYWLTGFDLILDISRSTLCSGWVRFEWQLEAIFERTKADQRIQHNLDIGRPCFVWISGR